MKQKYHIRWLATLSIMLASTTIYSCSNNNKDILGNWITIRETITIDDDKYTTDINDEQFLLKMATSTFSVYPDYIITNFFSMVTHKKDTIRYKLEGDRLLIKRVDNEDYMDTNLFKCKIDYLEGDSAQISIIGLTDTTKLSLKRVG